MSYRWNDLAFDAPAGWSDLSTLAFVDQPAAPRYHLTLTRQLRDAGPFAGWVEAQLDELRDHVPGFSPLARETRTLPAGLAFVSVHRVGGSGDEGVRQTQVFVDRESEVWIVTLSHADREHPDAAAALSRLLDSLRALP